jgi:hypothetical protein
VRSKDIARLVLPLGAVAALLNISPFRNTGLAYGEAASDCAIVTDEELKTEPSFPKPGYLDAYIDPVFGQKVTRITGDPGTPVPNVGGTWNAMARHFYSKDQAWNADMSLLLLEEHWGPHPLYLDGTTYEPVFVRHNPGVGLEDRWHPTEPDLQIYVGGNEIGTWNVRTGQKNAIGVFAGYTNLQFGPGEGNPSRDGRRVAALATDPSGAQVAFAYDLVEKKKYPDVPLSGTIDWVSISALGTYVVVNTGEDRSQVYDLQGNKVGPYWSDYGRPSHYDLTVDENGDEVAVGVSKSGPDYGKLIKRRLVDGQITVLRSGGWASHTSARNLERPGYVYVSYQSRSTQVSPYRDEVVAVKIDGSGIAERYAHMHTIINGYFTEAHASPSPDGRRVIWASNWDDAEGPIGAFVVEICSPTAAPIFADVPFSHPYNAEIETLYQAGYTAGCSTNPLMYCPEQTMNRAESSVFVERGIHTAGYEPPTPTSQVFADVSLDSWAAKWVEGLWNDEYTSGCGTNPLVYCPWQGHTRAEGCVFYLRMLNGATYEPPQPTQQTFADVPLDAWYARWVQAAYEAGLLKACETSPQLRFCPEEPLTRALAAYMMVRAKALP